MFTIINKETIHEAQAMCCVRARLPSQVWFQSTCPDHSTMVPLHSIGSHHPDLGGVHQQLQTQPMSVGGTFRTLEAAEEGKLIEGRSAIQLGAPEEKTVGLSSSPLSFLI